MGSFAQFQRKRAKASSSVEQSVSVLQASRSFEPPQTAPTSEQTAAGDWRAKVEHAARFGHSIARMAIHDPAAAPQGAFAQSVGPVVGQDAARSNTVSAVQRRGAGETGISDAERDVFPTRENQTGLPDALKTGVETLSGLSLDDVQVHYNSSKPAEVQALAYTQGAEIHVGPGQEQHLAHEAWHVVQQKQGRVQPTLQAKGIAINDDEGLEREADVMGSRSAQQPVRSSRASLDKPGRLKQTKVTTGNPVIQGVLTIRITPAFPKEKAESVVGLMRIEDRAPTNVKGSDQGDHTVASVLLVEQVDRQLIGKTYLEGLQALLVLLSQVESDVKARHTDFKNAQSQITPGIVVAALQTAIAEAGAVNPELKWLILADFGEQFLRLTNKQSLTAFLKKEQQTGGGGGENEAIKTLRAIDAALESEEVKPEERIDDFAQNIIWLMDFSLKNRPKDLEHAQTIIQRAVIAAINVVPKMAPLMDRVVAIILSSVVKYYTFAQVLPDEDSDDEDFSDDKNEEGSAGEGENEEGSADEGEKMEIEGEEEDVLEEEHALIEIIPENIIDPEAITRSKRTKFRK